MQTINKNLKPGKLVKVIESSAMISFFYTGNNLPYERCNEFTMEEIVNNTTVKRISLETIFLLLKQITLVSIKKDRRLYNDIINFAPNAHRWEIDKENSQYPYIKSKWWLAYLDENQDVMPSVPYNDDLVTGVYIINPASIVVCNVKY